MAWLEKFKKLNDFAPGGTARMMWRYLDSLNDKLLSGKRADEKQGTNHCVYEGRLKKKLDCGDSPEELIKGAEGLRKKGIIVVDAPADGYAKDFFSYRMLVLCFDLLMERRSDIGNFRWMQVREMGCRIPLEVRQEAIAGCKGSNDNAMEKLSHICADSVRMWMEENEREHWLNRRFTRLKKFLTKRLSHGDMFLLLPRGSLDIPGDFSALVEDALCGGEDNSGNLAVYVTEEGGVFGEEEIQDGSCRYFVKLDALTEEEIMEHIRFVSLEDEEVCTYFRKLLQENECVNRELRMPERLLLFCWPFGKDESRQGIIPKKLKKPVLGSTAQLYKVVIDACIEERVNYYCGFQMNENSQKVIYNALSDIAWRELNKSAESEQLSGSGRSFSCPEAERLSEIHGKFFDRLRKQDLKDKIRKNIREKSKSNENGDIWTALTQGKDFLVNGEESFYFQGCIYYFAAKRLYAVLREDREKALTELCRPVFLEKSNSQVYLFLADMIRDHARDKKNREDEGVLKEQLDIVWDSIVDDRMAGETNRVQVLVDILERFGKIHDITYNSKLTEFILRELSCQYYDSNLFDAIQNVDAQRKPEDKLNIDSFLKDHYGKLRKTSGEAQESVDNKKRRLAYYFGKVKCGIPEAVFEDLLDPEVHVHVKYHIILAVVENYGVHKTDELLRTYDERIAACESEWKKDAILYSDYLILRAKKNNVELGHGEAEFQLQTQLFDLLNAEEYWKRAHAAGALGRLGLYDSADRLLKQLGAEMDQIETQESSLKAVSYITEATCELFYRQNRDADRQERRAVYRDGVRKCVQSFLEMLPVDFPAGSQANSSDVILQHLVAYATIAEGILYLSGPVQSGGPQDIGRHIKSGVKNIKENCLTVEKALEAVKDNYEDIDGLEEKLEQFRNFEENYENWVLNHDPGNGLRGNGEQQEQKEPEHERGQEDRGSWGIGKHDIGDAQVNLFINKANFYAEKSESEVIVNKEERKMNVYNIGPIGNQQIVDGQSTGNFKVEGNTQTAQINDIEKEIGKITEIIAKNCTEQQQEAALPVISEFSESIRKGKEEAKKSQVWIEKIKGALSTAGDIVTIMSAPWWPVLISGIEDLARRI